jgi:hypothetical protein
MCQHHACANTNNGNENANKREKESENDDKKLMIHCMAEYTKV